jgi:chromosome segregation ATPase
MKTKQLLLTLLALSTIPSSNVSASTEWPLKEMAIGLGFLGFSAVGYIFGNKSSNNYYEKHIAETSHEHIATLSALCDSTEKAQANLLQLSHSSGDSIAKLADIIENDEQKLINLCSQVAFIEKQKEQVDMQILRWKANKTASPEEIAHAQAKSEYAKALLQKAEKIQSPYYELKPFAHTQHIYSKLSAQYADALKASNNEALLQQMVNNPAYFEKLASDIAHFNQSIQKITNNNSQCAHNAGYNNQEFNQLMHSLSEIDYLYTNAKPYIALRLTMHDVTRGASVTYKELLNIFKANNIKHQFDIIAANRQEIINKLIDAASRHGKPHLYVLKFVESLSGNCEIIEHQLKILKADISREIDPSFVAQCEQELELLKTAKSLIMQSDEYKKFCNLRDKEIKREQHIKQEEVHQHNMQRLQQDLVEQQKLMRRAEEARALELKEQNRIERQKVKELERQNSIAAQQAVADIANWASGTTKEEFERIKVEAREYKNQNEYNKREITRLTDIIHEMSKVQSSDSDTVKSLKQQLREITDTFNKTNNLLQNKKQQALGLRDSIIEKLKGLNPDSEEYEELNSIVHSLTALAY